MVALRPDWERVKLDIMEEVVRAKFSQNPDLRQMLIDTGEAELREGNYWHDKYWGVDLKTGEGENHLGIILMKLRAELGGAEYVDRVAQARAERAAAMERKAAALREKIDAVQAELDALPEEDFTGVLFQTKAYGPVTIQRREGEYLIFEAGGARKKFALPNCIAQGFLIPDDPAVTEKYKKRQELQARLAELRREAGIV